MNQELYRIWARNLRRFLKTHGANRIRGEAFEVGAGTGFWLPMWRELGATRVDGCDLVPAVVERLNARFGANGTFTVADLSGGFISGHTYSFVACMDVLLHVTEDAMFDRAVANVARLVAPGGRLLMKEPILLHDRFERPYNPELSSRARPLRRYRDGLEKEGLRLQAIAAATAVANNPIEGASRVSFYVWRGVWGTMNLPARIHPANAHWVGPLLGAVDPALMALGAAPSGKFALFSRPA
jgi:SAM-dependent methyltransferase